MLPYLFTILLLMARVGPEAGATRVGLEGVIRDLPSQMPPGKENENFPCRWNQILIPVPFPPTASRDPDDAYVKRLSESVVRNIKGSVIRGAATDITCEVKVECLLPAKIERGDCPFDANHSAMFPGYGDHVGAIGWIIPIERVVERQCPANDWGCFLEACLDMGSEKPAFDRLCRDTAAFQGDETITGACCANPPGANPATGATTSGE